MGILQFRLSGYTIRFAWRRKKFWGDIWNSNSLNYLSFLANLIMFYSHIVTNLLMRIFMDSSPNYLVGWLQFLLWFGEFIFILMILALVIHSWLILIFIQVVKMSWGLDLRLLPINHLDLGINLRVNLIESIALICYYELFFWVLIC